jgi:hypothetical protein
VLDEDGTPLGEYFADLFIEGAALGGDQGRKGCGAGACRAVARVPAIQSDRDRTLV